MNLHLKQPQNVITSTPRIKKGDLTGLRWLYPPVQTLFPEFCRGTCALDLQPTLHLVWIYADAACVVSLCKELPQ